MKKISLIITLCLCALFVCAQDYRNSLGFSVGSLNGLSYKGFVFRNPNVALQVDMGVNVYKTAGSVKEQSKWKGGDYTKASVSFTKMSAMSFTINPNFLYQKQIKTWENGTFSWFVGGGVSIGLMKQLSDAYLKEGEYEEHVDGETYRGKETINEYEKIYIYDDVKNPIFGKFGINAMVGCELFFHPLVALSIDFRPGYGLGWYSCSVDENWYSAYADAVENRDRRDLLMLHHFDWSLSIGLRFVLDKPF